MSDNIKATVDRKALRRLTMQAKRIAGGRVTLPALSGVRLEAEGDTLTVVATDLDTTYIGELDAEVDAPGAVLVPSKALDTLLSKMDGDQATLRFDGEACQLSDGQAELTLRTLALEDYPNVPAEGPWAHAVTIDAGRLKAVSDGASDDQYRPALCAVLFDAEGGEAVTTDGYRLMRAELDGTADWTAAVPVSTVRKVLAAKAGDEVTVETSGTHLRFTVGQHRWVSGLVEATFPNYRALWPDHHEASVTLDGARLAKATDRISAIAAGVSNTPIEFGPNGAGVELTVRSQEMGEASEKVPATVDGDAPCIAFNPKFLKTMADAMGGEVKVELRDGLKPAVFVGDRIRGLLMPMRVS